MTQPKDFKLKKIVKLVNDLPQLLINKWLRGNSTIDFLIYKTDEMAHDVITTKNIENMENIAEST